MGEIMKRHDNRRRKNSNDEHNTHLNYTTEQRSPVTKMTTLLVLCM